MRSPSPLRCTRRQALRGAAGTALALAAGDAFLLEPRWLEVTSHRVAVPDLPRALVGVTIAQVTDVHLSAVGVVHRAVTRAIAARDPQLVVLSGDVIDDERAFPALEALVDSLRGPSRAVVASVGNWEHWGGVRLAELARAYARAGARLLVNDSQRCGPLQVAATDDDCSGHADLAGTLLRVPRDAPHLFVTHAPGLLDTLPSGAPRHLLALAGHTHGGQVRVGPRALWVPPGSGRFVAGRYHTTHGPAYVSRGVGTSIAPMRVMCRPELPFFTLECA